MVPLARLLALALVLGGCRGPGEPADSFESQRITILMGGMRMAEGLPAVQVALKNKTPDELWVRTRFDVPAGGRPCELFEPIPAGASFTFSCAQPDLVFDRPYPVSIEVFADEGGAVVLEEQSTEFVFGAEFRYLLEAFRHAEQAEASKSN